MSERPVYVLDANMCIEAAQRYYAFDLAPGFWQALLAMLGMDGYKASTGGLGVVAGIVYNGRSCGQTSVDEILRSATQEKWSAGG